MRELPILYTAYPVRIDFYVFLVLLLSLNKMNEFIIDGQLFEVEQYTHSPSCGASKVGVKGQLCFLVALHES